MKKNLFFVAAALISSAVATRANENVVEDSTQVINLQEVTVMSRASVKTPVAFSNVSAAQIERSNQGQDIPYLLSSTPSVVTTSDAGSGIGYTTMRVRGTDASRINITANG
ncbi:MAG: TonB-dependent receptor plug domain-containing protein, partial [Muribaculaceae bacterium]|nr:TonB-dependent receptor plug domain-containing protein [Muribaculaceae bacterium]